MNIINKKLQEDKKLLSIYFTAGYPNLNDTVSIIKNLETSGVDGDDTEMSLYNANQVLIAENDDITYEAYVSEQNLITDDSDEPIKHPLLNEIFSGKKGSGYFKPSN